MFKSRVSLAIVLSLVMMMMFALPLAWAQPAQQGTATPAPTVAATDTPVPTEAVTPTLEPTATSVAPAVSPLATPKSPTAASTPSTLPTTGGSDDGTAALGMLAIVAGAVLLIGMYGIVRSRRGQTPH